MTIFAVTGFLLTLGKVGIVVNGGAGRTAKFRIERFLSTLCARFYLPDKM
jgi:hypothetical protein